MTTPATVISIQDVRNEFFAGAGPTDLTTLGYQIIGRAGATAIALSELRSRTHTVIQTTIGPRTSSLDGFISGIAGAVSPATLAGHTIRMAVWNSTNGQLHFDLVSTSPAGLIKAMQQRNRGAGTTAGYFPVTEQRGINDGYFNPVNRFSTATGTPSAGGNGTLIDWHIVT